MKSLIVAVVGTIVIVITIVFIGIFVTIYDCNFERLGHTNVFVSTNFAMKWLL